MVFRLGFDFFLDFGVFSSDSFPDGLHPSVTYLAGSNERDPKQVFEFDGKLMEFEVVSGIRSMVVFRSSNRSSIECPMHPIHKIKQVFQY